MAMGSQIQGVLVGLIVAVILMLVLIAVLVAVLPIITLYFGYLFSNMTATGIPFSEFFAANGLAYLILGAVVVLLIFGALFGLLVFSVIKHRKGRR